MSSFFDDAYELAWASVLSNFVFWTNLIDSTIVATMKIKQNPPKTEVEIIKDFANEDWVWVSVEVVSGSKVDTSGIGLKF